MATDDLHFTHFMWDYVPTTYVDRSGYGGESIYVYHDVVAHLVINGYSSGSETSLEFEVIAPGTLVTNDSNWHSSGRILFTSTAFTMFDANSNVMTEQGVMNIGGYNGGYSQIPIQFSAINAGRFEKNQYTVVKLDGGGSVSGALKEQ